MFSMKLCLLVRLSFVLCLLHRLFGFSCLKKEKQLVQVNISSLCILTWSRGMSGKFPPKLDPKWLKSRVCRVKDSGERSCDLWPPEPPAPTHPQLSTGWLHPQNLFLSKVWLKSRFWVSKCYTLYNSDGRKWDAIKAPVSNYVSQCQVAVT